MFDVNKILGIKKRKDKNPFTNMTLSGVIGKNPVSSLLRMVTEPKPKNSASLYKQKQWANFPQLKRQQMRNMFKDTDGDRVPDKWDCSPKNVMRQDFSETQTGVPAFSYPRSFGYRRRKVMMSPDKYLQLVKKGYTTEESRNMSDIDHEKILSQSNIDRLKPIIKHPKGRMTIPVLETMEGSIKDHEGRHRVLAAKQLGMTEIPVYMVESNKGYIQSQEKRKPTKAMKWEQQDPKFDPKETEYYKSRELGEKLLSDKDGDGFIAAADRNDNDPNNPSGAHYSDFVKGQKCVDCNSNLEHAYISSDEGPMCDICFQKKATSGYWTKNYPRPKLSKEERDSIDYANEQEALWEQRVMESNRAFANEIDSINDREQANRTITPLPLETPEIPDNSEFNKKENWDEFSGMFKPKNKIFYDTEYGQYKS